MIDEHAGAPPDVRVCVFGDSLVAGVGDPRSLGWVGRVAARTPLSSGVAVTVYPLGVRGETVADVALRVPLESAPRFARGDRRRLVVSAGVNDAVHGTSPVESVAALRFLLTATDTRTLVVGPPPIGDVRVRARIAALDDAFSDLCGELEVPYIATFGALNAHDAWRPDDFVDGAHPDQTGYGLLAHLVLHGGWFPFVGAASTARSPERADG